MAVPDFSPGEVLTASAMDQIGFWLVTTSTITSSPHTVSNCFTSSFANYRITIENLTNSQAANLQMQLSGITGNVYSTGGTFFNYGNGTVNGFGPAATNIWTIGNAGTTNTHVVVDVLSPQLAKTKAMFTQGTSTVAYYSFAGTCTSTTAATGFVLSVNAGTFAQGTVRVYGYRN